MQASFPRSSRGSDGSPATTGAESAGEAVLTRGTVHFTSLEKAVKGLAAAVPVELSTFENRIRERIQRPAEEDT